MSHKLKLLDLLKDCEPHNTLEIRQVVYGNEILNMARIAARVNDLKKEGYTIHGFRKDGKYWYQMQAARVEIDFREWAMSGKETKEVIYNFNGVPIDEHKKRQNRTYTPASMQS